MPFNQVIKKVRQPLIILPWIIFGFALIFYLYEYLLRVMPSVMSHDVMTTYHINARSFGNLSAFYYYIYIPMQLLVGLLIDRYGPRWLLALAVLLCSMGSYLYGSTASLFIAELGRLLIGFGSAFAFIGVLKFAMMWLPTKRFALITGITVSMGMLGGILGDLVLTKLVDNQGWRMACYLLALIGVVLALIIFLLVRNNKELPKKAEENRKNPDFDVLLYAGFLGLIKSRQVWINGIIGCLLYIPIAGFSESWQIPYLEQSQHFSHALAADATAVVFLGWLVGAPFFGWFSDWLQQRRLPLTFGASLAAILLTYVIYVPHISHTSMLVVLFLFGFFSSVQILVFPISREISRPIVNATAIALTNSIVMLSGMIVLLIGFLLDLIWHSKIIDGLRIYSLAEYQLAFLILPTSLVVAVFLTFFIVETNGKECV